MPLSHGTKNTFLKCLKIVTVWLFKVCFSRLNTLGHPLLAFFFFFENVNHNQIIFHFLFPKLPSLTPFPLFIHFYFVFGLFV